MKISIIVLNWNGQAFLPMCLQALQQQTLQDFEIVLVDNGSTDDSLVWLSQNSLPNLRVIELATNTGFSGGNLAGLAACDPQSVYVATLNNDTQPAPDWLENLVKILDAHTEYAAASSAMLFAAASDEIIAAAGIEIYQNGLVLDAQIGKHWQASEPYEVFGACAGAALYRRSAIEAVGFFDETFFAYLEDADLAWRLQLAGLRTLHVPNAKVWHAYSGTSKQNSPFKNFQLGRNRIWLIVKNWPAPLLWRYLPKIIVYDLAACVYTLLQGQIYSTKGRLWALQPRDLKRLWLARRAVQKHRRVTIASLERWLQPSTSLFDLLKLQNLLRRLASS